LLIAVSQPRKPGMGEMGWRYVSLADAGSNPYLALGVEQPRRLRSGAGRYG